MRLLLAALVTRAHAWVIQGGLVPALPLVVPECARGVQWFDAALTSLRGVPRFQEALCAADDVVQGVLPALAARALRPRTLIHLLDVTWAQFVAPGDYALVCRAMGTPAHVCATHDLDARVRIWCAAVMRIAATPGVEYYVERRGTGRVGTWRISPDAAACVKSFM